MSRILIEPQHQISAGVNGGGGGGGDNGRFAEVLQMFARNVSVVVLSFFFNFKKTKSYDQLCHWIGNFMVAHPLTKVYYGINTNCYDLCSVW